MRTKSIATFVAFILIIVVLAAVAICGVAIYGVDWLLSQGLSLLERAAQSIGKSASSDTATTTAATQGLISLANSFIG